MSLNNKYELMKIAKIVCRELRKNSTSAEKKLWEYLRNRKLCNKKFYRQYPIFYDLTGKESFFIADFYCSEIKLIIELDGVIHKYKLRKDKERSKILKFLGIAVLRFNNIEIEYNINEVIKKIEDYIDLLIQSKTLSNLSLKKGKAYSK